MPPVRSRVEYFSCRAHEKRLHGVRRASIPLHICRGRIARIRDNAQPDIQRTNRPGPEMPCSPDGYLTKPFRHTWRSNLVCESKLRKFHDAGAGKESSPVEGYKATPSNPPHYH